MKLKLLSLLLVAFTSYGVPIAGNTDIVGVSGKTSLSSNSGIITVSLPNTVTINTLNATTLNANSFVSKPNGFSTVNEDGAFIKAATLYQDSFGSDSVFVGGALYDFISTVSTTSTNGTENTLFSKSIYSPLFNTAKNKLEFKTTFTVLGNSTATRKIKFYYGSTVVFDSNDVVFASTGVVDADVKFIVYDRNEGAGTYGLKCSVIVLSPTAPQTIWTTYTELPNLDITLNYDLKCTGAANGTGASAGDIKAVMGNISWTPSAN